MEHRIPPSTRTELDITDVKSSLRSLMWRDVGIERSGQKLADTRERLDYWARYVMDKVFYQKDFEKSGPAVTAGWELQNMLTVCALIATAAHTRTESRGVHYRVDHPRRDDENWRLHLLWRRDRQTPMKESVR
jgi:L-aspartate oxidase